MCVYTNRSPRQPYHQYRHLNGHDKVSLDLEEVLSVDGYNPGLVRLGHVRKYHVYHPCRKGGRKGGGVVIVLMYSHHMPKVAMACPHD